MTITAQENTNLLGNSQFAPGKPSKSQIASIQGVNLIKLAIKAGDELPSHHVDKAAFAVLLQGRALFPIGEKRHQVTTGSFLEIPKNVEHSITAEEDSVFLVGIIGAASEGEC
jgi:quercetin dioxygenase-like cupin family protein